MASRSLWTGTVSFGMVSIPVKLYNVATKAESKTQLNQLHGGPKGCGQKLNQGPMECRNHGPDPVVVQKEDIIKGYEVSKGQWIPITEADLESLPVPSKGVITISSFVHESEIDPSIFENSYYLEADGKGGAKPYALLARALEADHLYAVAKVCIRNKEQLVVLRFARGRLYLHGLLYSSELKIEGDAQLPAEVTEQELGMAKMLTQMLTKPFDPDAAEHQNDWVEAFNEMIARKVENPNAAAPAPAAAPVTKELDLMEALRASVAAKAGTAAATKATTKAEPKLNTSTKKVTAKRKAS